MQNLNNKINIFFLIIISLILINNAGLAVGKGPLSDGLLEDWNRMIDTNIKGLLHISKEIIPILKTNKKGHIFSETLNNWKYIVGDNLFKICYPKSFKNSKALFFFFSFNLISIILYNITYHNILLNAFRSLFSTN